MAPQQSNILTRLTFLLLLAYGLFLHLYEVNRPIDASSYHSWREADLGMIARNFWRGDMNILHPQIDWRKDGPGYVECEFPLLAWLMALAYRLFGYHEEAGRVIAVAISLASLATFHTLARRTFSLAGKGGPRPPCPELVEWADADSSTPARFATLLFWFSPILVRFSTSIQPDPGMLLCAMLAVLFLLRWRESGRLRDALAAAAAAALAILLKAPAASLGLLFAAVCFEHLGRRTLRTPAVWIMGTLAILPPLAWYLHVHHFWTLYGNSLGLTNESHWIGMDLLRAPRTLAHMIVSMLWIELRFVYVAAGALLATLGLFRIGRTTRYLVYWLASAMLFYLLALRTSADEWAIYYHALTIPPACLLMALGLTGGRGGRLAALVPPFLLRVLTAFTPLLAGFTLATFIFFATHHISFTPPHTGESPDLTPKFAAAKVFKSLIPADALVVTLGDNHLHDETGRPMAHDDSPFLFWLDRKGFCLAMEDHSVAKLEELRARGARYAAFRADFPTADSITQAFTPIASSGSWRLVRL